jgi:hypothetical protein
MIFALQIRLFVPILAAKAYISKVLQISKIVHKSGLKKQNI